MKVSVIHSIEVKPFTDGTLEAKKLLNESGTEHMSISLLRLNGTNKKIRDKISDACYFIVEGRGIFTIGGTAHRVKKGDLVTIPKNTDYFDSGNMEMIVFRSPRYDLKNIEVLT